MEMREVGRRRDARAPRSPPRSTPRSSPASSSLFLPRGRVIAGPFEAAGLFQKAGRNASLSSRRVNAALCEFPHGEPRRAPLERLYSQGGAAMPLKIDQRLERLQTRLRETAFWRARADARHRRLALRRRADRRRRAVAEPRGSRALRGRSERSRRLAARRDAPVARPRRREPADARLRRRRARRLRPRRQPSGVSPRRPPLRRSRSESVARRPFGQPVADPRLQRARLVRLDLALVRFADRLAIVVEAAETLGAHEAAEHLVEAAEAALRAIDWPSTTADYIARVARRAEPAGLVAPARDQARSGAAQRSRARVDRRGGRGAARAARRVAGAAFRRRAKWR